MIFKHCLTTLNLNVTTLDLNVTTFPHRKRSCGRPGKACVPLNIALPYSLILHYKEMKGKDVSAII